MTILAEERSVAIRFFSSYSSKQKILVIRAIIFNIASGCKKKTDHLNFKPINVFRIGKSYIVVKKFDYLWYIGLIRSVKIDFQETGKMEYDWQLGQKIKCSDREKHQCLKRVAELVNLSMMARRDGLLSLIKVAEQSSSFLLNKGLQLVADGVNPQIVREVMENYIISGDYAGKDLLERCIILEGVTAIQQGFHPKVTKEFLLSFLGEDNYELYQKECEGGGSQDSLASYLKEIEARPASSSKGSKLDQLILNLADDAIERFLMEINTGDLAKLLHDMGGPAQIRLFNNLSPKAGRGLKDTLENLDSIDDAELAEIQGLALEIISDLQAQTTRTAAK